LETDSREFGLFIDGLRLERNMSREDLCDEIISLSQYKRYLRGDASIPSIKLVQIADRLKFSINDIHFMFRKKHNTEYSYILEIYSLIKAYKFNEAYSKIQDYKNELIVSEYNNLFFDFCFIKVQHSLKMVSDVHVLQIYSKLIDYPSCTMNESFNMIEITVLIEIVRISSIMNNFEPLEIMYRLLTSNTFQYSTSVDATFLPSIYSSLSSLLGGQKEHEKVVELSNKGIAYCIKHETSNALSHLFFFNAIAYHNLDKPEKAIISAKKCFMHLYIENKQEKFESFKKSFENIFEIKVSDIIDLEI